MTTPSRRYSKSTRCANEIWATELLGALIWRWGEMPWSFYTECAHWAYDELRHYRSVVEPLPFSRVFTPFETAEVSTAQVLALIDRLLSGRPQAGPIPLEELS